MKMIYNGVPINSIKVKHYEVDTNSATVQPSDLQAGVTCFGRGKKITGTGKSFEFASYGEMQTNHSMPIPTTINTIQIGSVDYPTQMNVVLKDVKNLDFATSPVVGNIIIENNTYPITVTVANNSITVNCTYSTNLNLQVFYGKDNYV